MFAVITDGTTCVLIPKRLSDIFGDVITEASGSLQVEGGSRFGFCFIFGQGNEVVVFGEEVIHELVGIYTGVAAVFGVLYGEGED
ncbi:hypothetical protein D3C87_1671730 [compost metagenome]